MFVVHLNARIVMVSSTLQYGEVKKYSLTGCSSPPVDLVLLLRGFGLLIESLGRLY